MNYYFTGIIILMLTALAFCTTFGHLASTGVSSAQEQDILFCHERLARERVLGCDAPQPIEPGWRLGLPRDQCDAFRLVVKHFVNVLSF